MRDLLYSDSALPGALIAAAVVAAVARFVVKRGAQPQGAKWKHKE